MEGTIIENNDHFQINFQELTEEYEKEKNENENLKNKLIARYNKSINSQKEENFINIRTPEQIENDLKKTLEGLEKEYKHQKEESEKLEGELIRNMEIGIESYKEQLKEDEEKEMEDMTINHEKKFEKYNKSFVKFEDKTKEEIDQSYKESQKTMQNLKRELTKKEKKVVRDLDINLDVKE